MTTRLSWRHLMPLLALGGLLGVPTPAALAQDEGDTQEKDPAEKVQPAADLPSADKLINQYIEAVGGQEAIDEIKAGMMKARAAMGQMGEMTMEIYWARPDKMFIKQNLPGGMGTIKQGVNGDIAWADNPMMGGVQLLPKEQARQLHQQNMFGTFGDMKERFKTLEVVDRTEFDGEQAYQVRGVPKVGPEQTLYFDADSHLLLGQELTQEGPMGAMEISMRFEDYKKVGGVRTFHKIISSQMGQEVVLEFTDIKFNDVDAAVFKVPDEVRKLADEREKTEGDGDGASTQPDDDDGGSA